MPGEIQLAYGETGKTLYAVIRSTTGTVWNGTSFGPYSAPSWSTYAVSMVEQGASGYYVGDFPSIASGVYFLEVRERAGATPAVTDQRAGTGTLQWDGTAIVPLSSRLATAGYTPPPTASAVANAVLAAGDIDGYSLQDTLKLCLAALAGKLSGAATTTITIRAADDSKNRIVAICDADGNRTAVTLDATG